MDTKIRLTAGLRDIGLLKKVHIYEMDIYQLHPIDKADHVRFTFNATELGWLQAQTTIDNFKDSLTDVEVTDETEDPR